MERLLSFKNFLKEDDTKLIKASGVDSRGLDNKIQLDIINAAIERTTSDSFITPYMALGAIAKVCAYANIILPQYTFMDIESGEIVFDVTSFGVDPGPYFIYFEYSRNESGTYDIYAELVNEETLEELLGTDLDGDNEEGEDPEHIALVKGVSEGRVKELTHPEPPEDPDYMKNKAKEIEALKLRNKLKDLRNRSGSLKGSSIGKAKLNDEKTRDSVSEEGDDNPPFDGPYKTKVRGPGGPSSEAKWLARRETQKAAKKAAITNFFYPKKKKNPTPQK